MKSFRCFQDYSVEPNLNRLKSLLQQSWTKLKGRFGLQKILVNIGWLFFDKICRLSVSLLVGIWVARFLGPGDFGVLSYCLAFTALFSPLVSLGLDSIVVRDIVQKPETANVTLGTAFVLRIFGSITSFFLTLFAIPFFQPDNPVILNSVIILSLMMLFRPSDVVRNWFDSQVQAKYIVLLENGVAFIFAAFRIALIKYRAPFQYFVWTISIESIVTSLVLLFFYGIFTRSLSSWKPSISVAVKLLKDSWSLILAGLAIMIYMRVDQIMLGQMGKSEAVGLYSAALRLSEIWYFIPGAIASSVLPNLIESRKTNQERFSFKMQLLFSGMIWMGIALGLTVVSSGSLMVRLLFGEKYLAAAPILSIHIWTGIFVGLGVASSNWLIAENLQIFGFYRTLAGGICNIILNFFLIPRYGGLGAALATLFSQAMAAFFFDIISEKTRPLFWMKVRAFSPFYLISLRKEYL